MGTPDLLQGRDALTLLYSLEAQEIEALAWEDVPACTGVQQKVLWRLGGFAQALRRYAPAATTSGLPHPVADAPTASTGRGGPPRRTVVRPGCHTDRDVLAFLVL